jgi:hypothetical protein
MCAIQCDFTMVSLYKESCTLQKKFKRVTIYVYSNLGVGIGRFRRKLEEIFFDRSDVSKVGNFTDSSEWTSLPTPASQLRFRSVEVSLGWAEISMSKPLSLT